MSAASHLKSHIKAETMRYVGRIVRSRVSARHANATSSSKPKILLVKHEIRDRNDAWSHMKVTN